MADGWETNYFSWLDLAQTLDRLGWTADIVLTAVTTNMQAVGADSLIEPNKAVVHGPLRVIPLEYPELVCRHIDFDEVDGALLAAEVGSGKLEVESQTAVAYRGGERFVPVLRQEVLEPAESPVRDNGVYLITGGLGSMGRAFAEHLVGSAESVNVVLTGRSAEFGIEPDY